MTLTWTIIHCPFNYSKTFVVQYIQEINSYLARFGTLQNYRHLGEGWQHIKNCSRDNPLHVINWRSPTWLWSLLTYTADLWRGWSHGRTFQAAVVSTHMAMLSCSHAFDGQLNYSDVLFFTVFQRAYAILARYYTAHKGVLLLVSNLLHLCQTWTGV